VNLTGARRYERRWGFLRRQSMPQILIVGDDAVMQCALRAYFSSDYEVIETSVPENAFAMALEHKPDAILLDLSLPGLSGFELCQGFSSLGSTQHIPIFVSGADERNRAFCQNLGASRYFTKPIDFAKLKKALAYALDSKMAERRRDIRIEVKVNLTLKGRKRDGTVFEANAITKNMSKGGFFCACTTWLEKGDTVQVFFADERERCLGAARLVRIVETDGLYPHYGFQFIDTIAEGNRNLVLNRTPQ
jgi:CheY-like chemotaxis protein